MTKNPSEFYDETYLKSPLCSRAGNTSRWEDNGVYLNAAMFTAELARATGAGKILEVGCGRGFVVRHLRRVGVNADGLEYGTGGVEHSVCDARHGDLTEHLPVADESYDLVYTAGVLSHIPEEKVVHALSELRRVATKIVWTNILVKYHELQQHHKTFKPKEWWTRKFSRAGLVIDVRFIEIIKRFGFDPTGDKYQWMAVWRVA
jgi:SAM-dependent methyltransferase